jgi:hypothetical protein
MARAGIQGRGGARTLPGTSDKKIFKIFCSDSGFPGLTREAGDDLRQIDLGALIRKGRPSRINPRVVPHFLDQKRGSSIKPARESAMNSQNPIQPYLPMLNLKKAGFILLACLLGLAPTVFAQAISITIAPPPLVVYEQPLCPADGYFWSPGYWAYGDDGYFWVPGTWIVAPRPGYLWTPGYWGFGDGFYRWHGGYWGPHIGFYGGVNYGYGYYGSGFYGGRWEGNSFRYNTAAWHVNSSVIHNTYVDRTVINNTTVNRVSYNGPGGITARPTSSELAAAQGPHLAATAPQRAHEQAALNDRNQHFSVNHGQPGTVVQPHAATQPVNANPAAVHHDAAHPVAANPATVHHEGAHPANENPQAEHHNAAHPAGANPQAEHHNTAHPANANPATAHHETAHPANAHHETAHHPAPHQPSKAQPKKSSGKDEKKEH